MNHRRFVHIAMSVLFVAMVAGLCAEGCYGQSFAGSITGLVTDPAGAVIPGAIVRIENAATRESRQTTTGGEGRYTFSQLMPGAYELTAEAKGFKKLVQTGIGLRAGQVAEVNLAMALGQLTESVQVEAAAVMLDTKTADRTFTLTRDQILSLPLNYRSPFALVYNVAGTSSMIDGRQMPYEQNQSRFNIAGGRETSNLVLIDGLPSTSTDWGGMIASPSLDSTQEMQVLRNFYDAQYGKTNGAVITLISKGGSADFHGTAFEFLRNDHMDANSWSNNRNLRKKTVFQRSQFGGNFSGPIWKSKRLFFFGGYEGLRAGQPASLTSTVPTALERQGNFSQTFNPDGSLSVIYDPFSTRPNPSGSGFVRTPFNSNSVPSTMFDPVALKVLPLWGPPNNPPANITNANNYYASGKQVDISDRYDVRVDWARTEKHTFFFRVTHAPRINRPPPQFNRGLAENNPLQTNGRYQLVMGNTFVPSPTWVINLQIGGGVWTEGQFGQSLGTDVTSFLGLPASLVKQFDTNTLPAFNASGYVGISNTRDFRTPRELRNLEVNLTNERGAHSIKFGMSVESGRVSNRDLNTPSFNFGRGMTSGPVAASNSTTSGNGLASMLLGTMSGASVSKVDTIATNMMYYAWYIQDGWRIGRRLTLNLGLRYDLQKPMTERYDHMSWFNYDAVNPLGATVGLSLKGGLQFADASNRQAWNTSYTDFRPRIGIAYKLTEKLVMRAGYGIFQQVQYNPTREGFSTSTSANASVGGDLIHPQDLLRNPFPNGLNLPSGRSLGLLTLVGQGISPSDHANPTGYVQNFSMDFQYQIGRGGVFELGYSGSQARKLPVGIGRNINQLPMSQLSLGNQLDQQVTNPFFGKISTGVLSGPTVARNRLLRPYLHYDSVNLSTLTPGASASFNALVAKFTKQFAGASIIANYQWSKTMDNTSETQGWETSDGFRNAYDMTLERSVSAHDIPHSLVTTFIYELPVGKGRKFGGSMPAIADMIVGGWQVSGISTFSSGKPQAASVTNTLSGYGFGVARPNIANLKDLNISDRSPSMWFNKNAFSIPAPYTIGNAPRYITNLRSDWPRNLDLAILKSFRWREKLRVEFRAEMMNSLNTPIFSAPNRSVGGSTIGTITGASAPRNVQLGLKINY